MFFLDGATATFNTRRHRTFVFIFFRQSLHFFFFPQTHFEPRAWSLKSPISRLVHSLKYMFSIFKQHYIYFCTLFHSYIFSHMFSNNNFQFLSACIKYLLNLYGTNMLKAMIHTQYVSRCSIKKKYIYIYMCVCVCVCVQTC